MNGWTIRTTMPDRRQWRVRITPVSGGKVFIAAPYVPVGIDPARDWFSAPDLTVTGRGTSPKEALISLRWCWRRLLRVPS